MAPFPCPNYHTVVATRPPQAETPRLARLVISRRAQSPAAHLRTSQPYPKSFSMPGSPVTLVSMTLFRIQPSVDLVE